MESRDREIVFLLCFVVVVVIACASLSGPATTTTTTITTKIAITKQKIIDTYCFISTLLFI